MGLSKTFSEASIPNGFDCAFGSLWMNDGGSTKLAQGENTLPSEESSTRAVRLAAATMLSSRTSSFLLAAAAAHDRSPENTGCSDLAFSMNTGLPFFDSNDQSGFHERRVGHQDSSDDEEDEL